MRYNHLRNAEELQCRREYILETIGSTISHFMKLYSSKERQCKMFYENSPQCDSFQLGEMIRYFSRKGLLEISCLDAPCFTEDWCDEDIEVILSSIRACSSYQIDRNHIHCGPRTRLLPLLDMFSVRDQIGICLRCWRKDRQHESWLDNPSAATWIYSRQADPPDSHLSCREHRCLKEMYTAEARNWTPSP